MTDHAHDCVDYRALASGRLDGELDEFESVRLERHLDVCDPCTRWLRDAGALAAVLNESTSVSPIWLSDGFGRSLRWRFLRAASVGAAAVSAAALAAFALAQPGTRSSTFASDRPVDPEALCASCMKKQAVTFSSRARSA